MSDSAINLRQCWLRGALLLWMWLQGNWGASAGNVTVPDTDPSILYQPPSSWHSSTDLCSSCLVVMGAPSYHEAIRLASGGDTDEVTSTQAPSPSQTPPPSTPAPNPPASDGPNLAAQTSVPTSPAAAPAKTDNDGDGGHDGDDGDDDDSKSQPGKGKRGELLQRSGSILLRRDADDPVTLSFGFNGSAIYLFGYQPLGPSPLGLPTGLNLTFVLDNQTQAAVTTQSTPGASGFNNTVLFSAAGLTPGPHQLVVNVGLNSTFLFNQIIYTALEATPGNSTGTATPLAQTSPSQPTNEAMRKHNIATFAGAVGGSVGVLAVFSMCLAFSIIRRRHLAAKRDRLERDHESLHTDASDDSPNMSGPAPFVPRYFPDTIIPTEPPTYVDALRTNEHASTLLAQLGRGAYPASRSYADIPPETPPPPLDPDAPLLPPPPPFPIVPPLPPPPTLEVSETSEATPLQPPGVLEASATPRNSVGIDSPTRSTLPELVPLLQSPEVVVGGERPHSRMSTRSTSSTRTRGSTRLPEPVTISDPPALPAATG